MHCVPSAIRGPEPRNECVLNQELWSNFFKVATELLQCKT